MPKIWTAVVSLSYGQAGCASAVHAISIIYAEGETDVLLFVNANNAFIFD